MNQYGRGYILLLLVVFVAACSRGEREIIDGPVTVLKDVTLIDGTGAAPRPRTTIVIRGERITRIGSFGEFEFGRDAGIIDAAGRYVIPGLIDTHAHVETPETDWPASLNTLLQFGITTIRDPAPAYHVRSKVRDRINNGLLSGPRMQVSGIIMDGPQSIHRQYAEVLTESDIRETVRRQAADNVDMVKIYMYVPPKLVAAAVDEAHRLGIKAVGHLKATSWTEAAQAGIDTLVHSASEGPTFELLAPGQREKFLGGDWAHFFRQWAKNGTKLDLDGEKFERLINALVGNRVEVNPTLVLMEAICWGDDPEHLDRLEPHIASQATQAYWGDGWKTKNPFVRAQGLTADDLVLARQAFAVTLDMIRLFHDRGVLLTAGSDLSMPWIVPGASLHREMELLVQAGISPSDVLTIATRNGAEAMGLLDQTGTVEIGKSADLVVLSADPTQDIRNTRRIAMVFLKGKVVKRSGL